MTTNVATLGRDPTSDVVLNDPKASRRHAVVEDAPDGMIVRDTGSANGVQVNGKKVERARIKPGDVLKIGDATVRILGAVTGPGTMIVEDLEGFTRKDPEPARPRPEPPRARANEMEYATVLPDSAAAQEIARIVEASRQPKPKDPAQAAPAEAAEVLPVAAPRPLTLRVLVVLWALAAPAFVVGGFALAWSTPGLLRFVLVVAGILAGALAVAMSYGLWMARPWARTVQIAAAVLGLCSPFFLVSVAVLIYMLRPDARWLFSDRKAPRQNPENELVFSAALIGAVVAGLLLTAGLTFLARTARTLGPAALRRARSSPAERVAADQMRQLSAAQEAFRAVCNTGYSDLAGLRRPSTVIENYPPGGPAFLPDPFGEAERSGYRFELRVEEQMPPAPGCPSRRFRRFQYAATPLSGGDRHLMVGPDGRVRAAAGRAANLSDPEL